MGCAWRRLRCGVATMDARAIHIRGEEAVLRLVVAHHGHSAGNITASGHFNGVL